LYNDAQAVLGPTPLIPKLRGHFAEFLQQYSLEILVYSTNPLESVLVQLTLILTNDTQSPSPCTAGVMLSVLNLIVWGRPQYATTAYGHIITPPCGLITPLSLRRLVKVPRADALMGLL
jgi:hypothetical protein